MRTVDVFGVGEEGEEIVVEKDVSCRRSAEVGLWPARLS